MTLKIHAKKSPIPPPDDAVVATVAVFLSAEVVEVNVIAKVVSTHTKSKNASPIMLRKRSNIRKE